MNPQIEFTKICQEILADKNKLKFQVSGGSMRPFLHTGDAVIVESIDLSAVNAGDIVFYKNASDKLCIHRVIRKLKLDQEIALLTKGDAWIHADPPILLKNVLGKVIAVERNGKYKRVGNGTSKVLNLFWLGMAQTGPFFYPLIGKLKKLAKNGIVREKVDKPAGIYEELLVKIPGGQKENGALINKMSDPGFDWDYFLQRAIEEKVAPLIYKVLETRGIGCLNIPAPVLEQFRNSYYQTLTSNILIFKKTGEILEAFHRQEIKVLVFKGPVLAELLYRDIGQRPITDIDLLVAPEDLAAVDRILQGLNYFAPLAIKEFSILKANPYRNSLLYSNPQETPQFIHLYWHLLNLFPYDQEVLKKFTIRNIWQTAVTVDVDGVPALTLSDPHQVIYLCLHAFQHAYTPGILLYDLHEFLQLKGNSLDWDFLATESFALGLNKYVYFGLYLTHKVFGAQVPPGYLEKLKPEKLSIFERRFLAGFVKHGFYGRHVNLGLVSLGMNETWGKRLEFIFRAIFPGKVEMALISQQGVAKISFADYIRRALGEKSYRLILLINKIMKHKISFLSAVQGLKIYRRLMGRIAEKNIVIRTAEAADKEALRGVYTTMTVPQIEQSIIDLRKEGFWLVALKNKIIAGALTVTRYEKDEYLWLIFGLETKPLFRGLGISRKLVQEAVKRATAAGAREVGLFVNKKAIPALHLYRQAGFRVSPAPYVRSEDELYLQLPCQD